MIKLDNYFLPEQEFYLDKIAYKRLENVTPEVTHTLICNDSVQAAISDDGSRVRVTLTRSLKINPEELFELSVSFGVILQFNPDTKNDIDWSSINLADEFKANGQFALGHLYNRINVLIAEITSSYGQAPILLPSGFEMQDKKDAEEE